MKLDTADKKQLVATPQQQHNLSIAPNRNVLLTAPPNRGKSSLCLQILARSAPFHSVYVLHGTPGTKEYDIVDHKVLHECPPPSFWKEASEAAKKEGLPIAVVVDDYCVDQGSKAAQEYRAVDADVRISHGYSRVDHGTFTHEHSTKVAPVLYDTCVLAARRSCIMELSGQGNEHGAEATGSGVRAVQAFATRQALVRAVRDGPAARSGAMSNRR